MGLFQDGSEGRECRFCEHWGGDIPNTASAVCTRKRRSVNAIAKTGCVFWVRATGSDDDAPDERRPWLAGKQLR